MSIKKIAIIVLCALAAIFVAECATHLHNPSVGTLAACMLDVGQGDSLLITTPDNYTMLIDTGRGDAVASQLIEVLGPIHRDLDLVVITHADADHAEGLLAIISRFNPEMVMWNGGMNSLADAIRNDLFTAGTDVRLLDKHHSFRFGCCLQVDVVWPDDAGIAKMQGNENDHSVGLVLSYGDWQLFTAGDLGAEFELQALHSWGKANGQFDLLKVGHHGSSTSTSAELLELLQPVMAFISVGEGNAYGHPTDSVLDLLHEIPVWRTDLHGRICVFTDGESGSTVEWGGGVENLPIRY